MARVALALALAAFSAACSSQADSFSLHLTWQADGCPPGDEGVASCTGIPISCDAHVLIRVLPAEGDPAPYYSHCYELKDAADACALADLAIVPSLPIPNEMVRVQVAMWSDEQLIGKPVGDDGCPEDVRFDASGEPSIAVTDTALVPAVGGQIYFPVGDRREARVSLACPRYDLLDLAACRDKPLVKARVRELSFIEVDTADADALRVAFGAPMQGGEGWFFPPGLQTLDRAQGASDAVWTARLAGDLPVPSACVKVDTSGLETGATPSATCQDPVVEDGELAVGGFLVRKALVAKALQALELDEVPEEGLVIGMVVNELNRPVAGARVSVDPPSALAYPTMEFDHTGLDSTSANGIFLSTEAPFNTRWGATDPEGLHDDGTARGGLIGFHISVVILRIPGGGEAR